VRAPCAFAFPAGALKEPSGRRDLYSPQGHPVAGLQHQISHVTITRPENALARWLACAGISPKKPKQQYGVPFPAEARTSHRAPVLAQSPAPTEPPFNPIAKLRVLGVEAGLGVVVPVVLIAMVLLRQNPVHKGELMDLLLEARHLDSVNR